jgi:hypothetical protein
MTKFMSCHVPAEAPPRQVDLLAQAAQADSTAPYRALTFRRGSVCVMEAPSKDNLAAWFQKMHMPCEYITRGTRASVEDSRGLAEDAAGWL